MIRDTCSFVAHWLSDIVSSSPSQLSPAGVITEHFTVWPITSLCSFFNLVWMHLIHVLIVQALFKQNLFYKNSQKKMYKSCHWGGTFSKGTLLHLKGAYWYLNGTNMFSKGTLLYLNGAYWYLHGTMTVPICTL